MVKKKKILSVIMSIAMVLTAVPLGMFGTAVVSSAEGTSSALVMNDADGKVVMPQVSLASTSTVRTANATYHMQLGNSIVKATPSGIAELSSSDYPTADSLKNAYYAGETPVSPQVVLTSDYKLDNPTITCLNSTSVTFSGVSKSEPDGGPYTYTWSVTGGTVDSSIKSLNFQVGYSFKYHSQLIDEDVTNSYVAYCSSAVEQASHPGGIYAYRVRSAKAFGSKTMASDVIRILGANTFGGFYDYSTSTDSNWGHGYAKFTQQSGYASQDGFHNIGSAAASAGYGLVSYINTDTKSDGNVTLNTGVDRNRPVSTLYVDESYSSNLQDYAERIAIVDLVNRSNYTYYVRGIYVRAGEVSFDEDITTDDMVVSKLGLAANAKNEQQISTLTNVEYPFNGNLYQQDLSTLDNGNRMAAYTVVANVGTHYSSDDRVTNYKAAVDLRIVTYDKSNVRGSINEALTNFAPTTVKAADSEIGLNPNPNFYNDSTAFNTYLAKLQQAQYVLADPDTDQNTIKSTADALDEAVGGLQGKVKEADYSRVNAAKADARENYDATQYTDASWNNLMNAVNAVQTGYSVFYQTAVDKMAKNIQAAVAKLEYADADFTNITQLLNRYDSEDPSDYTGETWAVLEKAVTDYRSAREAFIAQTGHDYKIIDQATINAAAATIAAAFDALKYSLADYTEVDRYAAAYESLLPNKDIYDPLKWSAAEAAYNAIVRGLNWTKQADVDRFAANLKKAIDELGYKLADYSAVDAAVKAAGTKNRLWYTADSWDNLQDKIDAVVEGLDYTHQNEVNNMAAAINTAIDDLEEADGDYSAIDALDYEFSQIDQKLYTAASVKAVVDAFEAVDYSLYAKDQKIINGYAKAIRAAIDALVEKPADYTAVNAAVAQWNARQDKDNYTTKTVTDVQKVINGINWNLTITNQATVDGYVTAIQNAVNALKLKKADYTGVYSALSAEREKVNIQTSFQLARNGYSYYESDSYNAMLEKANAVVYDLDIDKQTQVDGYAAAINSAISNLKFNDADYSAVYAALEKVPDDIETNDNYDVESAAAVLVAVGNVSYNYKTDNQALVDQFAAEIEAAVANLKYKSADYTAVDNLISQWNSYPNKDSYTASSVSNVDSAVAAVVRGYTIVDQAKVDAMATKIQNAINALKLDVADYSAVENICIKANKLLENEGLYTKESVDALRAEIGNVVYNLKSAEQSRVDGFAQAISNAVDSLKYKPLDRTNYDIVVAKIPGNLSIYTADSVQAMRDAKSAADKMLSEKNEIIYQDSFDSLVNALDAKIAALKVIYADYTEVDKAIDKANALVKANYVDFSGVENAVAAVERNLDFTQQSKVNNMAKAINNAINALVLKDADYTAVVNAKASVPADLTVYTDESVAALQAAISNVVENLKIDKQSTVDLYAAAIVDAISNLKLKAADYTELDALVASVAKMKAADYKNWNEIYWTYIYSYVNDYIPAHHNYDGSKQAEVNTMKDTLQSYIDMLVPSDADYTFVYIMIDEAQAAIDTGKYTDKSVAALEAVIDSINYNYSRLDQDNVDLYVYEINDAIEALVEKPSDFSKIDELYNWFMGLNSRLYKNYTDVKWDYVWPYYNNDVANAKRTLTKISQQSKVDKMYDVLKSYCDMLIAPVFVEKDGSNTVFETEGGKNYITGIGSGISEKKFLENCVSFENVEVEIDKSANSSFYLGTGTVVNVYVINGSKKVLYEQYTIVVYGDYNGDGLVNGLDIAPVSAVANGLADPENDAVLKACDFGKDGAIDNIDLAMLMLVVSGNADIDQSTGTVA